MTSSKDLGISDEAAALIKSDLDLYDLLGLSSATCDEKAIESAWRRTSLKYHPDKNRNNPAAVDNFYVAKNAAELLASPAARAAYDGAREARVRREEATKALDGRRRAMMEELERAERKGAKRKREEEEEEREIKRLARDGERRRREREEARVREREEELKREVARMKEKERELRMAAVFMQKEEEQQKKKRDGAGAGATPVKKNRFEGVRSAPSTPAGKGGKMPAFSFSPKPAAAAAGAGGGNKFEQDTLARLKAKQAEKRRLEEQIRAEEAKTES